MSDISGYEVAYPGHLVPARPDQTTCIEVAGKTVRQVILEYCRRFVSARQARTCLAKYIREYPGYIERVLEDMASTRVKYLQVSRIGLDSILLRMCKKA